ncbi:MAG: hypothetical protein WDZ35_14015 [Crocinitomicaceae bacterium]
MKLVFIYLGLIVVLMSCHKKYEEKAGTFAGMQVNFEGSFDQVDTISYSFFPTKFVLDYNKSSKSYMVTGGNGTIPDISFDRKDFKENEVSVAGIGSSFKAWKVTLDNDTLEVFYEELDLDDYKVYSFEGFRE